MNEIDLIRAPLAELYSRVEKQGPLDLRTFARLLAERLQDGRAAEVAAFLRECDEGCLRSLGYLSMHLMHYEAPWEQDSKIWLAFAGMTVPRGVLLGRPPRRSQALSQAMQALAHNWQAAPHGADCLPHRVNHFVTGKLFHWFWYAEMPQDEVRRLLEWANALCRETPEIAREFVTDIDKVALGWLSADSERRQVLACHFVHYVETASCPHAIPLLDFLLRDDPAVFAFLLDAHWSHRLVVRISPSLAQRMWGAQIPILVARLLPLIAGDYQDYFSYYRPLVLEIMASRPDLLADVPPLRLAKLLPLLDVERLRIALPVLGRVVAGSSAKALRKALVECARLLAPGDFVAAGWLQITGKHLLPAWCDILLGHPDPAAGPLLVDLLATDKLSAASASQVQTRLEELGLAASAEDGLAALEAQAAAIGRPLAAIKIFAVPEILTALQPLSGHAARVLLHLAATSEEALPPLAEQLLAQVSTEGRARFAQAVVDTWLATEGDPRHRWVLKLVPGNADDRVVAALAEAARSWSRQQMRRAVQALELLAAVDTLYALARVQDIAESRTLKGNLVFRAWRLFVAAAERRGLSEVELAEELTPDFGLSEGVSLVVGSLHYRVELQGNLSLRVVNERGRVFKSLPALKDEALRADWHAAQSKLKMLASGLKTIVRQQAPRLQAALVTGKRWPLERWRRLFLQHPLLRSVGRSLIWRVEDAPALAHRSFRIAEDFSLVNVEDDLVHLPEGCSLSLWHPATAEAGEREAWQVYFADYQIEALVEQIGAPSEQPEPAQLQNQSLLVPFGLVLEQRTLERLLERLGYRRGPVEDSATINWHEWHLPELRMSVELLHSGCPDEVDPGHEVTLERFIVRDLSRNWAWLDPAELPRPLLATLMGQIRALQAQAIAVDKA